MLQAFGVGEVPISISGDPTADEPLQHTIRDVGGVTRTLVAAQPGDVLGVRGPYGTGWDVADAEGGDVALVAGGIGLAPLRPALLEVLANRERYRRVVLLYGARSPQDLLFGDELERWRGRLDLTSRSTVDSAPDSWRGRVGLVTGPDAAGRARPGAHPRAALRARGDDALRRCRRCSTSGCAPSASGCPWSGT